MNRRRGRFGKSQTDRLVMGLCGGIAEYIGISSTIVRAAFMMLLFFTGGYGVWIYFIAASITPVAQHPNAGTPAEEAQKAEDWKRQWQRQRDQGMPEGEIAVEDGFDSAGDDPGRQNGDAEYSEDEYFKSSHKKKSDWS